MIESFTTLRREINDSERIVAAKKMLADPTNIEFQYSEEQFAESGAGTAIVAVEDIPAFAPVTSLGRVADSDNPSAGFGRVIGIAKQSIGSGNSGEVIQSGVISNPA